MAQISDSHLYEDENRPILDGNANPVCVPERTLARVLEHVALLAPRPELLLLTGDLSDDGSAASYRRLDWRLANLGIPYGWIPGNHDTPANMVLELSGRSDNFATGGWQVVLLDSKAVSPRRHDGELAAESLRDLERFLAAHREPTLIAVHHPPLEVGSPWLDDDYPLRNASELRQMIHGFPQVKGVIFGHAHQVVSQRRRGVWYLGTASTSSQLVPGTDDPCFVGMPPDYSDAPLGYRLLWLHRDGTLGTETVQVERD